MLRKLQTFILKASCRVLIPNSQLSELVELEAKRKLGKLGGGESIALEVKTAANFLTHLLGEGDFVFFDVGANVGNYSFEFMKLFPNVKVVAFEPGKAAHETLQNRFSGKTKVILENSALGSSIGNAELFFDLEGSGLASLTKRNLDHIAVAFKKSEVINITTAENWIETNQMSPSFVKIDVEGHELDVLKGFGNYLSGIPLIQFEFGGCNIDTQTFFKDFWILLSPHFDLYRIAPHGAIRISNYSENEESFMTSNILAVNKSE